MTTYIALLRGINVGGKNMIKMADLRQALASAGMADVQTYIQSGNILFHADEAAGELPARIRQIILDRFGYSIRVVVRSAAEWNEIIAGMPYTAEELAAAAAAAGDAESHYLALLGGDPRPEKVELVQKLCNEGERMHIHGREVYLLLHMSVRDSKLAQKIDQLAEVVTVRNWNTVLKLAELAGEME